MMRVAPVLISSALPREPEASMEREKFNLDALMSHHQRAGQHVMQGLLPGGEPGHHESNHQERCRNDLCEIPAGGPAETDLVAVFVNHIQADNHFAERG